MIRTSRKPIVNSHTTGHLLRQALIVLAGAATTLGLAAVPSGATPSAPARTVAPDQAPRSAVAVAFDPTGSGFAFYRGKDHAVYMRTFFGSKGWSAQSRIGGHIVGAPAAAVARTTVVVAARGTDNTLRLRMMHNGTWGPWTNWGGALSAAPAITGTSLGRIDVFIRGADHALWVRTLRPGKPLANWKRLGGDLSTAPAAVAPGENHFEVYAGGPDHFVWMASSDTWAWTSLGGRRTYSTPAAGFVPRTNGGWLLIRGTDNTLWGKGPYAGAKWRRITGELITPTAAGTRQPTAHIIAVVRDTSRAPWTATSAGSSWSAFTRPWTPHG